MSPTTKRDEHTRDFNDFYGFHRICRHAKCRRRSACVGAPDPCLTRHLPALPEAAKAILYELGEAQKAGWSFDDAMHELREEVAVLQGWRKAVGASPLNLKLAPPSRSASSGRASASPAAEDI